MWKEIIPAVPSINFASQSISKLQDSSHWCLTAINNIQPNPVPNWYHWYFQNVPLKNYKFVRHSGTRKNTSITTVSFFLTFIWVFISLFYYGNIGFPMAYFVSFWTFDSIFILSKTKWSTKRTASNRLESLSWNFFGKILLFTEVLKLF